MEKSNSETRQLLKAAFDKFDTDKNGVLDVNEATQVLKELNLAHSKEDLEKFFKNVDADHDGTISFEELYVWYTSNKAEELGPLRQGLFKVLKQAKKEARKIVQNISDKQNKIDHHHFGVNLGKTDDLGTKIELRVLCGKEASAKYEEISKDLNLDQPVNVILQFHSSNPSEAKEGLVGLFNDAKDMAGAMGVQLGSTTPDKIQVSGAAQDNHVRVGLQVADPEIIGAAAQVDFLINMFVPADLNGSLAFELGLNTSIGKIYDDVSNPNSKTLAGHLVEGVSVNCDARVPHNLVEFARQALLESPESVPPHVRDIAVKIAPLLYLNHSEVQFDFDSNESLSNLVGGFVPPFKLGDLLPQLQGLPIDQFTMMAPPLAQFLEIAEQHLSSDLKIYVRGPQSLISLHLKTEGLGKLWSAIKGQ